MILSIKNNIIDLIYQIKNRGILINSVDYDFYDIPIYKCDCEVDKE